MVVSIASTVSVRARGAATQNRILEKAVHIASVEGLSAMSLATLAKATSMSKSGLFAHFRSKEALQIAIIDEAERIFFDGVVRPAQQANAGIERLMHLVEGYVEYSSRGPFEGGCFFAAAAHEFDGRPGPVRDRVIQYFDNWTSQVRTAAQEAAQRGHLKEGLDVESFLFELQGIGLSANVTAQLGGGAERARVQGHDAVKALMERVSAPQN
ncbi:MAG TPA: TetR/AcrR family transcriptional regulator [Myxococcota bacterium]